MVDLEGVESFPVSWKGLNGLVVSSLAESIQRKNPSRAFFVANHFQLAVFVYSFLYQLSSFPHLAFSVLRALEPFSLVIRIFFPVHLSVAMSQVFHETTDVITAATPSVLSFPVSLVIYIGSFVFL